VIVIDSNIAVAALRSNRGASFLLMDQVASKEVHFAISTALILVYEDAALRQRAEIQLSDDELEAYIDSIAALGHAYFPFFLWRPFLPDPKDDHVLELAVVSQAKEIVTFNLRDFRGIEKFGIRAITPKDFLIEKGVIK
jgi:predicted nucleic acid-binding protein